MGQADFCLSENRRTVSVRKEIFPSGPDTAAGLSASGGHEAGRGQRAAAEADGQLRAYRLCGAGAQPRDRGKEEFRDLRLLSAGLSDRVHLCGRPAGLLRGGGDHSGGKRDGRRRPANGSVLRGERPVRLYPLWQSALQGREAPGGNRPGVPQCHLQDSAPCDRGHEHRQGNRRDGPQRWFPHVPGAAPDVEGDEPGRYGTGGVPAAAMPLQQ